MHLFTQWSYRPRGKTDRFSRQLSHPDIDVADSWLTALSKHWLNSWFAVVTGYNFDTHVNIRPLTDSPTWLLSHDLGSVTMFSQTGDGSSRIC